MSEIVNSGNGIYSISRQTNDDYKAEYDYTKANKSYTEIIKLARLLLDKGICFEICRLYDGYRVGVLYGGIEIGDAIEHCDSYGRENNLLELRGFDTNDVTGDLTAEQVVEFAEKSLERWNK